MGRRPQLGARIEAQERIALRSTRLHSVHDPQRARSFIQEDPRAAHTRGNGYPQDEEGVGGRHSPRKAATHERFRSVCADKQAQCFH